MSHADPASPGQPPRAPERPRVVIVETVRAPYRLAQHRRLNAQLPEVTLEYVYTHAVPDQPWHDLEAEPARSFGAGRRIEDQGRWMSLLPEWRVGGRIIREVLAKGPLGAVVVSGYADAGRLRIIRWCAARRIPVLLSGDSNVAGDRARGLRRFLKNLVLRRVVPSCSAFLPFGTAGQRYFERYGARPEQCFFAPSDPDEGPFLEPPPGAADQACAHFDLDPARKRIVFCARLIARKRPDLVLDLFQSIADQRPDWDLVFIGDGPQRDVLKSRLRPDLPGRVRFLGFIAEPQRIAGILHCSHVMLHPADDEPWGLVIHEAAAAGLAIVATETVGAAWDLVRDGENGRRVPAGRVDLLRSALLEVTEESNLARMGAASKRVVADWRLRASMVLGVRRGLAHAGVIPAAPQASGFALVEPRGPQARVPCIL